MLMSISRVLSQKTSSTSSLIALYFKDLLLEDAAKIRLLNEIY